MKPFLERTEMLLGTDSMERLQAASVLVFGIGGVGSYVVEALARAGIGSIDMVDHDTVAESNINRQLIALETTVGRLKVETARERLLAINPALKGEDYSLFYSAETAETIDFSRYDYVVDAIDTVSGKLLIIEHALAAKVPVISSMGTGNKLHPECLRLGDVFETTLCPLARVMRRELRRRGIEKLPVVYSTEPPVEPVLTPEGEGGKRPPGSVSFVPGAAGLILAGAVVRHIAGVEMCNKE